MFTLAFMSTAFAAPGTPPEICKEKGAREEKNRGKARERKRKTEVEAEKGKGNRTGKREGRKGREREKQ